MHQRFSTTLFCPFHAGEGIQAAQNARLYPLKQNMGRRERGGLSIGWLIGGRKQDNSAFVQGGPLL